MVQEQELNRLDDLGERAINAAVMAGHSQVVPGPGLVTVSVWMAWPFDPLTHHWDHCVPMAIPDVRYHPSDIVCVHPQQY